MKQKIYIIGCGLDCKRTMTEEAKQAIEYCDLLLGSPRLLEEYDQTKRMCLRNEEILEAVRKSGAEKIGVLVSGDPGFFSAAKKLTEELSEYEVEIVPGISSLSYFCARLKTSWFDAIFASVHGREIMNVEAIVMRNKKTFLLAGGDNSVSAVCKSLVKNELGSLKISVGQNLSYENEKIETGSADEFADREFDSLSVMLIENPDAEEYLAAGIPDDEFIRGEIPMTKFETRSVSVAKLRVLPTDIIYDIGAGTGSVSIEMTRFAYLGHVYALEQKSEAVELIERNKKKFKAFNLSVIQAKAPVGLEDLPPPDKVFIGGSAGCLDDIVDVVTEKNANAKIVINAVTLETLNKAINVLEQKGYSIEVTQVSATQLKQKSDHYMMQALNPVFVICGENRK